MTGFLSFRTMVTTGIVKTVYGVGAVLLTLIGLMLLLTGQPHVMSVGGRVMGFAVLIVGNLAWRVLCENIIVLFSMHDILGSIERNVSQAAERRVA